MALPGNGVFVIQGEMSTVMTALKRSVRWSSQSHNDVDFDLLLKSFQDLKALLNRVEDIKLLNPNVYLEPFLEVIRSEETTGPVTGLALSAVQKFISYGLIDSQHEGTSLAVENIASAVTKARFMSADSAADALVLLRILHTLRTLLQCPLSSRLTDNAMCAIALSCFRLCFESRLNELLRRTAENVLKEMVLLMFARLPQFTDDANILGVVRKIKMNVGAIEQTKKVKSVRKLKQAESVVAVNEKPPNENPDVELSNQNKIVDMQGEIAQVTSDELTDDKKAVESEENDETCDVNAHEYINPRGVRFKFAHACDVQLIPYGIVCVHELFRFLISLCNPTDKQNTETMIHLALSLLTIVFEVAADSIDKYPSLLNLVKDDLCKNLFALLSTERIAIFSSDLQVSFLIFESLRTHLKFHLEFYLTKLMDIVAGDNMKVTYEHKELALDNIVQLWRIPGFVTELYLNFDCNLYSSNLFEDLTNLIGQNACQTGVVYHANLIALDALLTVVEVIRNNCALLKEMDGLDEGAGLDVYGGGSKRRKISTWIPSRDEIAQTKMKKKWLPQGTEYFNTKPKKGIQFLQEHNLLGMDLNPSEIVHFLREHPGLDKKMIGEYISSRNNLEVLEAFVKSFNFTNTRIDEALRLYLETFRLPGEAPLISLLLEHFAEHWHKCNGEPFANADAAFTLAYAVIMLNVDQHNHNVKRQNIPMTPDQFKRNLKKVNGGDDFDANLLTEIYDAIKTEEIVMPAEQTGLVRENYLWKVLLRRGASKDGEYYHVTSGAFDRDIFEIVWTPTIRALAYIFDKSDDALVYQRAVKGFQKCAFISAQFAASEHVDQLLETLTKFSVLDSEQKYMSAMVVEFAGNEKAQIAFKTVFSLVHLHGDFVRDGWKQILNIIHSLYYNQLLPKTFTEVDDYTSPSGRVALNFEIVLPPKTAESGLLSSLYSYVLSSDATPRVPTADEQEQIDFVRNFIAHDVNVDLVVSDSKFLQIDALLEMIRNIVEMSSGPDGHRSLKTNFDENSAVFFLELMLSVVLQNRDRAALTWKLVQDHIYSVMLSAASCDYQYLLERAIIGLLRLAIRLMRSEDMTPVILQSLQMLMLLKSSTLLRISRQIAFGLYELLKTSAQNIHTDLDWNIVFKLLECVGAGVHVPKPVEFNAVKTEGTKSDGECPDDGIDAPLRGYTSDSELTRSESKVKLSGSVPELTSATNKNVSSWILVNTDDASPKMDINPSSIVLERRMGAHNPVALLKCCESLAFLVRDVAHITPYNFEDCVRCIRTFVEASLNGSQQIRSTRPKRAKHPRHTKLNREKYETRSQSPGEKVHSDDDSDVDDTVQSAYHQISIQLLDLMYTLHTRTAHIFKWWAEEHGDITVSSLWPKGWCPLLQGITRLCCDTRKQVRMSAITYLQRALLVPDLQSLNGTEWEECFYRVLFPLLAHLLDAPQIPVSDGLEEARVRAATVLSKVFLHHLKHLLTVDTFVILWLTILDFLNKYMHAENSDLLYEAVPELLKNMLLVMNSAEVFGSSTSHTPTDLWTVTWQSIDKFLPNMKDELFKPVAKATLDRDVDAGRTDEKMDGNAVESSADGLGLDSSVLSDERVERGVERVTVGLERFPVTERIPLTDRIAVTERNSVTERIPVTESDIVNATRSSIMLQPLSDSISAPLFVHLGMVSSPIDIQKSPVNDVPQTFDEHPASNPAPNPSTYQTYSLNYSSNPNEMFTTCEPTARNPFTNYNHVNENVTHQMPAQYGAYYHAGSGSNVLDGERQEAVNYSPRHGNPNVNTNLNPNQNPNFNPNANLESLSSLLTQCNYSARDNFPLPGTPKRASTLTHVTGTVYMPTPPPPPPPPASNPDSWIPTNTSCNIQLDAGVGQAYDYNAGGSVSSSSDFVQAPPMYYTGCVNLGGRVMPASTDAVYGDSLGYGPRP